MSNKEQIENAIQYLGNRGHSYEPEHIIKAQRIGDYFFIHFKDEHEVDLYNITNFYGECENSFDAKKFKWNDTYMRKCVTGEIYQWLEP